MTLCVRCGDHDETVSHGLCKECRDEIPESFEPSHLPLGFYIFGGVALLLGVALTAFILTLAVKGFILEFIR